MNNHITSTNLTSCCARDPRAGGLFFASNVSNVSKVIFLLARFNVFEVDTVIVVIFAKGHGLVDLNRLRELAI